MKSVQVTGPGQVVYTDAPEPPASGGVLVGVHRVGICGTDVSIFSGGVPVDYPRIMGHEMIGEVIEGGGTGIATGQRVLIDPAIACGLCPLCREGRPNLCLTGGLLGRDADGVFAERVVVPADRLLAVPSEVSDLAAGLLQVLGTCVHAHRSTHVVPGDVAVVVGLGVSGLLLTQLLSASGATVVGVTRSEWKRELALRFGAAAVAPPDGVAAVITDMTGGFGADLVVEAVGTEATLSQSIELTRVGGKVVVFGTITQGGEGLPYYQLYLKELTLWNPRAAVPADYARGIELTASGALDLEPIVTDELHLSEAALAFERVTSPDSLKVLMEVG